MFNKPIYIWDEIKNGNKHHKLKRYILIQFKKFGVYNFNDIMHITDNDEDYLYILYTIIVLICTSNNILKYH